MLVVAALFAVYWILLVFVDRGLKRIHANSSKAEAVKREAEQQLAAVPKEQLEKMIKSGHETDILD